MREPPIERNSDAVQPERDMREGEDGKSGIAESSTEGGSISREGEGRRRDPQIKMRNRVQEIVAAKSAEREIRGF